MKITDQKTILQETVECSSAEDATAAITKYWHAGWRVVDSEMKNGKWYYTFEKLIEEGE